MKIWHDKAEIIERMAQARRDAYNSAPRGSNDTLEASYFFAMMAALFPDAMNHVVSEGMAVAGNEAAPEESSQAQGVAQEAPILVQEEPHPTDDPAGQPAEGGGATSPTLEPPTAATLPENDYGSSG